MGGLKTLTGGDSSAKPTMGGLDALIGWWGAPNHTDGASSGSQPFSNPGFLDRILERIVVSTLCLI